MPRLHTLRSGPSPGNRKGLETAITFFELRIAFNGCLAEWGGRDLPEFNGALPSKSPEHVLVEVRDDDGPDPKYNRSGFYRLEGITPEDAEDLLNAMRETRSGGFVACAPLAPDLALHRTVLLAGIVGAPGLLTMDPAFGLGLSLFGM